MNNKEFRTHRSTGILVSDLGEENEDIVFITSTLYDALDMLKNLVKQQQKAA